MLVVLLVASLVRLFRQPRFKARVPQVAAAGLLAIVPYVAIHHDPHSAVRLKTIAARDDLTSYAQALEPYFRRASELPELPDSLDELPVLPKSKDAAYSLRPDGTIVATGIDPAHPKAFIALAPLVASRSRAIDWICYSEGLRDIDAVDCEPASAN